MARYCSKSNHQQGFHFQVSAATKNKHEEEKLMTILILNNTALLSLLLQMKKMCKIFTNLGKHATRHGSKKDVVFHVGRLAYRHSTSIRGRHRVDIVSRWRKKTRNWYQYLQTITLREQRAKTSVIYFLLCDLTYSLIVLQLP